MSKIEFHIQKSVQGGTTNLAALTIQETTALIEILSALKNIALHENNLKINIGVVDQSACAQLGGDDDDMDYVHKNMLKVVYNERDRDNVYVNSLIQIQEQISENQFEMKIVYRKGDDEKDIKEYFDKTFHRRKNFKKRNSSFMVEFMEGTIKKSGENSGNWSSFKFDSKGLPLIITCNEKQASLAGKFLFKEGSKISTWGKIDAEGKVKYSCTDIYLEESQYDYYSEFKNFFSDFFRLSEVERIKLIHYKLKDYYNQGMLDHAKKFIKFFTHSETEKGYLLSILILSKNFVHRDELAANLKEIENLLKLKNGKQSNG